MDSIDAGRRDTVLDALGHPVEARDSKDALTLAAFDLLHRASRVWARDRGSGTVTLRQRIDYGDAGDPQQPAADRAAARARNLLGRVARQYDEAGLVTSIAVDFKGNRLEATRRVIADAPILATFEQAAANGWQVEPFQVDWSPGARADPGRTRRGTAGSQRIRRPAQRSTRSTGSPGSPFPLMWKVSAASCTRPTTGPARWSRSASTTPSTSSASPTTPKASAP